MGECLFFRETDFVDMMIPEAEALYWTLIVYQFIFSMTVDGKIKASLYDFMGSTVDYDAPSQWFTIMAYSADGTRLIHHAILALALCYDLFLLTIDELYNTWRIKTLIT